MNLKCEIRQEMIQKRKAMSMEEHITKSNLICNKIIDHPIYKQSNVIFCYASVNNEVCLNMLIEDAFKTGKRIAMPKVDEKNMNFYYIESFEDLKPGYMGIPEPDTFIPAKEGNLMIVPGVAFSKRGERLGYGGGFYDRFLLDNSIYTIGVGYDFQIMESLPTEEHDIKINEILSNYLVETK